MGGVNYCKTHFIIIFCWTNIETPFLYALCPCVLALWCLRCVILTLRGEMRGDRYCVTRVTSCLAEWPLLRYLAIFLSLLTDLEITPISPARLPVLYREILLVCKCDTDCFCSRLSARGSIHFSGVGNFRTLHSTHSRFYSTNHCIALLNNERSWLGSKNKIF